MSTVSIQPKIQMPTINAISTISSTAKSTAQNIEVNQHLCQPSTIRIQQSSKLGYSAITSQTTSKSRPSAKFQQSSTPTINDQQRANANSNIPNYAIDSTEHETAMKAANERWKIEKINENARPKMSC
jgi:hypothetical protein